MDDNTVNEKFDKMIRESQIILMEIKNLRTDLTNMKAELARHRTELEKMKRGHISPSSWYVPTDFATD